MRNRLPPIQRGQRVRRRTRQGRIGRLGLSRLGILLCLIPSGHGSIQGGLVVRARASPGHELLVVLDRLDIGRVKLLVLLDLVEGDDGHHRPATALRPRFEARFADLFLYIFMMLSNVVPAF